MVNPRNLAEHKARHKAVERTIRQAKFAHLTFEELRAEVIRCSEGECEWASMYRQAIDPLNKESKYIHETAEFLRDRAEHYATLEAQLADANRARAEAERERDDWHSARDAAIEGWNDAKDERDAALAVNAQLVEALEIASGIESMIPMEAATFGMHKAFGKVREALALARKEQP